MSATWTLVNPATGEPLGHWQQSVGLGLNGKTLGVLGLGSLGSRVARVGRAFEMDVIAWSQNLTAGRAA